MLRTIEDLQQCSLVDREGEIGRLYDALFDSRRWVLRWFVLKTLVAGEHALVSPALVNNIDWGALSIELDLPRNRVDNPENLEIRYSCSRHVRDKRAGCCAYSRRRRARDAASLVLHPEGWPVEGRRAVPIPEATSTTADTRLERPDLSGWNDIKGLRVYAMDGHVGHLADVMVDESWAVRHLIVVGNGIDARGVVLPVGRVQKIDWDVSELFFGMTRAQIVSSLKYRPQVVLRRG